MSEDTHVKFCLSDWSWQVLLLGLLNLKLSPRLFKLTRLFDIELILLLRNAIAAQQPSYLSEILSVYNIPRRDLRSGKYQRLHVPRNKLKFADCAFSHAAPTIGNGLPTSVTSSNALAHFNSRSKLNCTIMHLTVTNYCIELSPAHLS